MIVALLPIFFRFRMGNYIPTVNSSKIIPISANKFKTSTLLMKLKGGVCGPMIIPAPMYPKISGCFNLYEIIVITAAIIIIVAKSCKIWVISIATVKINIYII